MSQKKDRINGSWEGGEKGEVRIGEVKLIGKGIEEIKGRTSVALG